MNDHINLTCALVLEVLGAEIEEWNGRIHMSKKEKEDLLTTIEASAGHVKHLDGALSLEEILSCIAKKENHSFLREDMPESMTALAYEDLVLDCFSHRDKDKSGKLDMEEWILFLDDLENLHHGYLLSNALRQSRAFFGMGRDWVQDVEGSLLSSNQLDRQTLLKITGGGCGSLPDQAQDGSDGEGAEVKFPEHGRFQVGLDPEWRTCLQDFSFYSANNHPLHGIFCCSPDHPLSWQERLVIEAVTVMFTYFTIWLAGENAEEHFANDFMFSIVFSTLPGVVLWWTFFLLFTCPKLGIANEAKSKKEDIAQARKWQCVGESLSYVIAVCVLIGVISFAITGRKYISLRDNTVAGIRGRVQGYIVFWLLQTFVYFNPIVAWGQPHLTTTAFGFLGNITGLGKRRIERQKFQYICAKALKSWEPRQHREQLLKDQNLWRMPRFAVWEYETGEGFKDYSDDCAEFIEHKYQRWQEGGPKRTKVFSDGRSFMIAFEKMEQSSG